MSGGHACQTSEETTSMGFHAEVHTPSETSSVGPHSGPLPIPSWEACEAQSDRPPPSERCEADTMAYTDAYADTMAAPAHRAGEHPNWCVDLGQVMLTMTTFELWEALERGHVLPRMRVWREGMECWSPVCEVSEFAWAMALVPEPPPASDTTPAPESSTDATTGPLPEPVVEAPPESAVIAARPPGGARWIALGAAVAVAAVASAMFVRKGPPPPPPVGVAPAAPPATTIALVAPTPPDERPAPQEPSHRAERGQRRLPRDGRRAYGR